ncbi:MAG: hypothetical protein Q4P32_12870, partial [Micrococcales bacterium]|nr:hypothetical protein [Micrococcales bacterium]
EPAAPSPQLTDVLAAVEAARADVGERALLAQRRLDVLSVVDSVLAGVPATQAGGLVSAGLGGGPAALGAWQTSRSGQHLVSSLQSLNALFASLGAVAGLSAVLGPTPPTVRTSGSSVVVATPSASALDSPEGTGGSVTGSMAGMLGGSPLGSAAVAGTDGQGGVGAGDGLWVTGPGVRVSLVKTSSGSADANRAPVPGGVNPSAVANTAGGSIPPQDSGVASAPEVATGPAAPWQAPRIPYDGSLTVVSVAARAVVASAGLPTGMVLNAGRGFSFALITHAGGQTQATTSISVGPGARLSTLAAAINASSAPVYAQVEGFGTGSQTPEERLVLFATETGADTDITIVDGLGSRRPSALGAIAHLRSGADSIVDALLRDGSVVRVASATTSLPGALPGVDIALRASGALIGAEPQPDATLTAEVSVRPDTPAAARHLSVLVCAAAAVLDGLAGRGPIDVAAARALAQDPAVADLSARIAVVVGGPPAAGAGGVSANATPGGATAAPVGLPGAFAERPLGPPLPGVHVDRHGRLQVDEEAFLLAHGMAPSTSSPGCTPRPASC